MASKSVSNAKPKRAKNGPDDAWKYGKAVAGPNGLVYVECKFCGQVVKGTISRLKNHLAGTKSDVKPYPNVEADVRAYYAGKLKHATDQKHKKQSDFDEQVNYGSYFLAPSSGSGSISNRGIRGPMDRYVQDVDDDVEGHEGGPNPGGLSVKEMTQLVSMDIGRYFFECGVPFNHIKQPAFVNMIRSVGNYGRGFKCPTVYDLTSWIIDGEVDTTQKMVSDIKSTWAETGVTLMSDGWTDIRGRNLINFMINNPQGTVFLRSIDASDMVKDAPALFKLLDDVVEEIGENLVLQVVTDNAAAYKAAGRLLMEKRKNLYWTPCAAHCINLILQEIGELPTHKNTLAKAKKVCIFIYNHLWVLALMRKFTSREIIRPGATRFATCYLTLDSMLQSYEGLQQMFTSREWVGCMWANKDEGKKVKNIILSETFWESVRYVVKSTRPLVGVLRLVDGEVVPAMGFLYGAIDEAKEKIASDLGGEPGDYSEIWKVIDRRWDKQLHSHLHACAYWLNPRHQYGGKLSTHVEIKIGLFSCMERFISVEEREIVHVQLDMFKKKDGLFGYSMAQSTITKRSPADWWAAYGDGTPELQRFAIKVLSLTCSASGCERNWSTFNLIHTKRRNRLSAIRLNKLVFIMYNKKLRYRHLKRRSLKDNEDPLMIDLDDMPSDDEWVAPRTINSTNTMTGATTITNNITPIIEESDGEEVQEDDCDDVDASLARDANDREVEARMLAELDEEIEDDFVSNVLQKKSIGTQGASSKTKRKKTSAKASKVKGNARNKSLGKRPLNQRLVDEEEDGDEEGDSDGGDGDASSGDHDIDDA